MGRPASKMRPLPERPDQDLCASAVQALRELVIEAGGVTDEEAALLLVILGRLRTLERTRGRRAAGEAARRIKRIWLTDASTAVRAAEMLH